MERPGWKAPPIGQSPGRPVRCPARTRRGLARPSFSYADVATTRASRRAAPSLSLINPTPSLVDCSPVTPSRDEPLAFLRRQRARRPERTLPCTFRSGTSMLGSPAAGRRRSPPAPVAAISRIGANTYPSLTVQSRPRSQLVTSRATSRPPFRGGFRQSSSPRHVSGAQSSRAPGTPLPIAEPACGHQSRRRRGGCRRGRPRRRH